MELILIACSGMKRSGGQPHYPGSRLETLLQPDSHRRLLETRAELARMLGEPSGPDLDGKPASQHMTYLTAFQRYQGRVFKGGEVEVLYPEAKDVHLLIISALYGVLDAEDPIRMYDHEMNNRIPGAARITNWWKEHGLGSYLMECIINLRPTRIHDLLTINYRDALGHQLIEAVNSSGIEWKSYGYPGEGMGALWRRGQDLKFLLLGVSRDSHLSPTITRTHRHMEEVPARPHREKPHVQTAKVESGNIRQVDRIRDYVMRTIILPAREKGEKEITIRAGAIAAALDLQNRMPNVCNAMDALKFLHQANVKLVRRTGPRQGATVEWTFEI